MSRKPSLSGVFFFGLLLLTAGAGGQAPVGPVPPEIKVVKQADGVWRFDRKPAPRPAFWQELLGLFGMKPVASPSFGRSVAFLTGVSKYETQSPQLPFVASDLTELRNFLLTKGGFDTVYEARDGVVRRSLIEDYLVNKFSSESNELGQEDRLLFYYSGHGSDKEGRLGFLNFSRSQPGNFAGDDVLEIDQFTQWARIIVAKHLLIVLDACASGLAVDPKVAESPADRQQLELNALSGQGSGFLITAGTANQKAYQISVSSEKGYSVLTNALLTALQEGSNDDAFMTINEVFGKAEKIVARFDVSQDKKMAPRIWPIGRREGEVKGTFVFVNINANNPPPPPAKSGIVVEKGTGPYPTEEQRQERLDLEAGYKQQLEMANSDFDSAKYLFEHGADTLNNMIRAHEGLVQAQLHMCSTKTEIKVCEISVYQDAVVIASKLTESVRARFKAGDVNSHDMNKTELHMTELKNALLSARSNQN
jgi:hypothetical protein